MYVWIYRREESSRTYRSDSTYHFVYRYVRTGTKKVNNDAPKPVEDRGRATSRRNNKQDE
jgi:beta-lactamase class D